MGDTANSETLERVGIEYPPDYIFKFRERRQNPAKSVLEGGGGMYIPDHGEYIEGKGTFVYYRGFRGMPAPLFPSRNVTPDDAVYAVNPVKRTFLGALNLLASKEFRPALIVSVFIGSNRRAGILTKMCESFNHGADVTMAPFYLKNEYYCDIVKEIRAFVTNFLIGFGVSKEVAVKTGEVIGTMFEYDWAYRWPLQDVMSYASKEAMLENLPKELTRLVQIESDHDPEKHGERPEKFKKAAKLLKYAWHIPSLRKNLKKSIESVDFEKCRMDEGEIYHTLLYGSYNVQGKTLQERLKIYEGYHGTDQSKWPPRIVVKNN